MSNAKGFRLMTLSNTIFKSLSLSKQLGSSGFITHIGRKLLTAVPGGESFRFFLMELKVPQSNSQADAAAINHTFRFATENDIQDLIRQGKYNLYDRDLASLRSGNRCLLQLDRENLVGYTWISSAPMVELMWGIHFNMADDMVYNYNGFTVPSYRGTSFQALRHLKILNFIQKEGKKRLFAFVHHTNYKSLQGVYKSGYRTIGVISGNKKRSKIKFSMTVEDHAWAHCMRLGPCQYDR